MVINRHEVVLQYAIIALQRAEQRRVLACWLVSKPLKRVVGPAELRSLLQIPDRVVPKEVIYIGLEFTKDHWRSELSLSKVIAEEECVLVFHHMLEVFVSVNLAAA